MPIRKFRHVADMEDALWYERGDPALFAAIARVWDFAQRTCQPRFPPGVPGVYNTARSKRWTRFAKRGRRPTSVRFTSGAGPHRSGHHSCVDAHGIRGNW